MEQRVVEHQKVYRFQEHSSAKINLLFIRLKTFLILLIQFLFLFLLLSPSFHSLFMVRVPKGLCQLKEEAKRNEIRNQTKEGGREKIFVVDEPQVNNSSHLFVHIPSNSVLLAPTSEPWKKELVCIVSSMNNILCASQIKMKRAQWWKEKCCAMWTEMCVYTALNNWPYTTSNGKSNYEMVDQ